MLSCCNKRSSCSFSFVYESEHVKNNVNCEKPECDQLELQLEDAESWWAEIRQADWGRGLSVSVKRKTRQTYYGAVWRRFSTTQWEHHSFEEYDETEWMLVVGTVCNESQGGMRHNHTKKNLIADIVFLRDWGMNVVCLVKKSWIWEAEDLSGTQDGSLLSGSFLSNTLKPQRMVPVSVSHSEPRPRGALRRIKCLLVVFAHQTDSSWWHIKTKRRLQKAVGGGNNYTMLKVDPHLSCKLSARRLAANTLDGKLMS